ncbi:Protein CobW [Magnetospirillum sp. LM-5]|uniref:cobalamin biosynthesis protein CobW n=1 Tax=Magnetospirillum sp. LM-5 TaxID=2681466 RepID=UPI0013865857|nr:cobalamin biosynthesis protein CobW [Magnetospirillum sp. LM-5]CAA7621741.1 Protein CobW [Magnetospirillum sp. LM-5]
MSKVPATVITGFLGAGKTTLVRHLMENNQGKRIALIVNEFGDKGVDGELLASCGISGCAEDSIIELANGCLCCTVADEFLPTIQSLLERASPPDHILIETSGLALPKPLVKAFHWPEIRSKVTVDGVIAVVDAAAVADGRFADSPEAMAQPDHDNPLEEVFEDQLACADLVLLNKTDLLHPDTVAQVHQQVAQDLRAGIKVVRTSKSAIDPRVVLGLSAAAEDDLAARPSHHDAEDGHDHDDFTSFAIALPAITDVEALEDRILDAIATHDILRLKGFLAVEGKAARAVVQAVGTRLERWFDRPWKSDEVRTGHLVVIGRTGLDRSAIEAMIRK